MVRISAAQKGTLYLQGIICENTITQSRKNLNVLFADVSIRVQKRQEKKQRNTVANPFRAREIRTRSANQERRTRL